MAGTRKFPQTQQQADAAGAAAMLDAKAEAPLVGAFRDSDAAMNSGAAIGSKEIGDAVETPRPVPARLYEFPLNRFMIP